MPPFFPRDICKACPSGRFLVLVTSALSRASPPPALVTCRAAVLYNRRFLLGRHRILEGLCPDKAMLEASTQELLEEREEAYEVLEGSGPGPADD